MGITMYQFENYFYFWNMLLLKGMVMFVLRQKLKKFKNVQLHAAKRVTGIPIFASQESLYFETGWESLIAER